MAQIETFIIAFFGGMFVALLAAAIQTVAGTPRALSVFIPGLIALLAFIFWSAAR